jgi:ribosome-associated protein
MQAESFELAGDFVELHSLLKLVGAVDSGGAGKALVASGAVRVDGQVELRKSAKIRAGQVVTLEGFRVRVVEATQPGANTAAD